MACLLSTNEAGLQLDEKREDTDRVDRGGDG